MARQVLLEDSEQAVLRVIGDQVQVQSFSISGELLTPFVATFDHAGNALAWRSGELRPFGLPSDRAFVASGETSVFVVRQLIELPPETFTTPQGEVTIKPIVPEDRLWFLRAPGEPLPLPLVRCDKCYVRSLALRAIGGTLIVMWQLSSDETLQLAQLDYDGNVLAQRSLAPPAVAGLAFQRFRATPQSDYAAVATAGALVLLLDETLQTVREDLSLYDVLAWSDDRLIVSRNTLSGDLLVTRASWREELGLEQRYTSDFLPTVAGVSRSGAGVVGLAANVPYLVAIDANGKKIGGDIPLAELPTNGATSAIDGLLIVGDRTFSLFQQRESVVERIQVDCK